MRDKEKETNGATSGESLRQEQSSPLSIRKGDLLSLESIDPALDAKMRLINDAIDEIGFTPYQWKLFCLNGFGYAVDSLILLIQSIIATYAQYEFHPSYDNGVSVASLMYD